MIARAFTTRRRALRMLAGLAPLVVALAAAQPAAADQRFFQFNLCGNICNDGDTDPVAGAIKNSILDFHPHAVGLNEACYAQFDAVRDRLQGTAWEMRGRWVETKGTDNDCPGDNFGNAVLTRNDISDVDVWALPHPTTETRKLLCVKTQLASRTSRVCSTHIRPGNDTSEQAAQIREVRDHVNAYIDNGRPVVLMGDFNVVPTADALDPIYHDTLFGGGATGRFEEVDQGSPRCRCGESTLGDKKYDYVFLSARDWMNLAGDATHSDYSDHDPLRGWADPQ